MRFNLLLVTSDSAAGSQILKVISKVFKDNFIFEVQNMIEAEKLLAKIQIDLLLVDLDSEPADLIGFSTKFPSIEAMAFYSVNSFKSKIDLSKHKLFKKSSLQAELFDEIKLLKKEKSEKIEKISTQNQKEIVSSSEFSDFSALMTGSN